MSTSAIIPGRITISGIKIFGIAAYIGVICASLIFLVTMALCTTRKSVHQYPKASTKPSPNISDPALVPNGLVEALPIPFQTCSKLVPSRLCLIPSHPPTLCRPIYTKGAIPSTIKKNCNTSLYTALVKPPRKV